jgi:hypothetical protein
VVWRSVPDHKNAAAADTIQVSQEAERGEAFLSKAAQLFSVKGGESFQLRPAEFGERQPPSTAVTGVGYERV